MKTGRNDAPLRMWECEAEPLPDGRWLARCPELDLAATGSDADAANRRLMQRIAERTGN